ncbi:MAG: nucleotidyltransferase [Planctomycetota bacterium]
MTTQPDFEELLRLFEENKVRYMIIGGYAVAYHGYPRFTKDIDIFFANSPDNVKRVRAALLAFGFSESEAPESLLAEMGNIIRFGVPPVQVDLVNQIDGVTFEETERNAVRGRYGRVQVSFIGKTDLIRNKRASGRPRDQVDADALE